MVYTTEHRKSLIAGVCSILFIFAAGSHAQSQDTSSFDPGFKERAISHVTQLAALGDRVAGGKGEKKASLYIRQQLEKMGLRVDAESFQFQAFNFESAVLKVKDTKAEILKLYFNPYSENDHHIGQLIFLEATDKDAALKTELDDKIVVTTGSPNFFVLIIRKPRAIVSISQRDFDQLRTNAAQAGEIIVRGELVNKMSENLVGTLTTGPNTGKEIILSAHYDSWKGPGANDNASGVAVLLELARRYNSLKSTQAVSMRFVFFGAEEFGALGARAYLDKHQSDIKNCKLLFNIDTVGGNGAIFADTRGGVKNVPSIPKSQLPRELNDKAANDIEGRWMLLSPGLSPLFTSSNAPDWLRTAIADAGKEQGREVKALNGMGSDHRVFVQAGIVATSIAISGGAKIHSPDDVANSVNAESLEAAGRLVSGVIDIVVSSRLGPDQDK